MGISNNIEFTAYVDIDWADKKHETCVQTTQSNQREFVVIPHQVKSIDEWVQSSSSTLWKPSFVPTICASKHSCRSVIQPSSQ